MDGRGRRNKGLRGERDIVARHAAIGVRAERIPLSGSAGGSFTGDVLIDNHWRAEVKVRAGGQGFVIIERWLEGNDFLFMRRDRGMPIVAMTWEAYADLISAALGAPSASGPPSEGPG